MLSVIRRPCPMSEEHAEDLTRREIASDVPREQEDRPHRPWRIDGGRDAGAERPAAAPEGNGDQPSKCRASVRRSRGPSLDE